MKMTPQQYCLRWKHHHSNVQNMFAQLLEKERFCDVTLYCSPSCATHKEAENMRGVSLRAHRVVLAACSELLGTLLGAHEAQGEPVLVIDGAEPKHLKALLDYMYTGEMNVHHSQLASLLKTAEELRIKGLTDIRWNNKDEPPDCQAGNNIVTTTFKQKSPERKPEKQSLLKQAAKSESEQPSERSVQGSPEAKREAEEAKSADKCSVNGGPPPLIKLPAKDKGSPAKRENSDTESPSPKRQRHTSANDNTDDDSTSFKMERDSEWQHGNMQDITAERVVGWGAGSEGGWSRDDDDDWADAPADIGSFLQTKLKVDEDNSNGLSRDDDDDWSDAPAIGSFLQTKLKVDEDNSGDEESCESTTARGPASSTSTSVSTASNMADIKIDLYSSSVRDKPTVGPKSGPTDPRFKDVVKLNDYLQHGRRPHFWEENYVKRVMEAVRMKELEMKQAAEILGVSYGTLYGRYRDVYGCINRPYRGNRPEPMYYDVRTHDFWHAKGPSEVLERLQRGEISMEGAALTLGVSATNLAAYMADAPAVEKEFEPIPIEVDPSLTMKTRPVTRAKGSKSQSRRGLAEELESLPGAASFDGAYAASSSPGKWPTIRVASIDTLREPPASPSPSALMRTRPDLTIVAAKKTSPDKADEAT